MLEGQRIVVGVDGSAGSIAAMTWAADTAARVGATIVPVVAWEYPTLALLPFPAGMPVPPVDAMQADSEVRAEVLVEAALASAPAVEVADPIVRQGSPGKVLCDVTDPADLLVVGSRGLGSVKGVLLGSVSAHCATAAPCPVAVIPVADEGDEPIAHVANGVILVGVDGSPSSDDAVRWADAWAPEDATLTLIHVWNVPVTSAASAFSIDAEALEDAAKHLLDNAACLVEHHKVDTLRVRGDARTELAMRGREAEMVVIGARGHSRFERFLMGSVADHTVHHLVAPTVIVNGSSD